MIVQKAVPKKSFFPGQIELVRYFGQKNISFHNGGQNIIIIVFMAIPADFLSQFGTDNQENDEHTWTAHVHHIIEWFCVYARQKEEKNGSYSVF